MNVLAVVLIVAAVAYKVVTRAAVFLFSLFIVVLATIGLYDLIVLPFKKGYRPGRRVA